VVPVLTEFVAHEEQATVQPHQVIQDGAPSHTARGTITEMQNRGLHLLGHPSLSPDLNLAEHVVEPR
jgi:transposase